MMKRIFISGLVVAMTAIIPTLSAATVEWDIRSTLRLDTPPIDMAVSQNGQWIFVLTETGNILVLTSDGTLKDTINIGQQVDQIKMGPRENILLLKSRQNRTVQVLILDFIQEIDITGAPFKGSPSAPVTIIVFSEFQCVYCKSLVMLLDQVLEKNPDNVKLVFKNFPLQRHKLSQPAAAAALAADSQGKFWEYHDLLFKYQEKMEADTFLKIAAELGLDLKAFEEKRKSPETLARIQRDAGDGQRAGVRGTPTVFINGRQLKQRTLKGFQELIDKELVKNRVKK